MVTPDTPNISRVARAALPLWGVRYFSRRIRRPRLIGAVAAPVPARKPFHRPFFYPVGGDFLAYGVNGDISWRQNLLE